jgi:hypothetical protein
VQSLAYARAAAAVRTCAYRLRPPVVPGQMPFMQTTASEVTDILTTGTCLKLEQFRWVVGCFGGVGGVGRAGARPPSNVLWLLLHFL